MLNEINQSQKDKYCMVALKWVPRIVKFIETESEVIPRDWDKERMGSYCLMGKEIQFEMVKKFQR